MNAAAEDSRGVRRHAAFCPVDRFFHGRLAASLQHEQPILQQLASDAKGIPWQEPCRNRTMYQSILPLLH
jgi:hypothetical protein